MPERRTLIVIGLASAAALLLIAVLSALSPRPLETFAFYVFGGVLLASSLGVALTRSIVRSAAWLLGALVAAAGLFLLLSANFLAVVQLIVYAGGILVLIVFGVMLTARGPQLSGAIAPAQRAVAIGLGVILFAALCGIMIPGFPLAGESTLKPALAAAEVARIGAALLHDYALPLQMLALLLLAVMIGAACLARPEKK